MVDFYAHLLGFLRPDRDAVLIKVSSRVPAEYQREMDRLGYMHYGSVKLSEIQGLQLGVAGFSTVNENPVHTSFTSIADACRIFPHVRDLVERLEQKGIRPKPMRIDMEFSGKPEDVLRVLKEYAAKPYQGL